jgi:FixJ family two-component response regulator
MSLSGALPLVIVVDDDPSTQRTLARVLKAGGFESAVYESAEAFLDVPPPRQPIGLLLDQQLGGMSGIDLLRKLDADGTSMPTIMITAFDSRRSREEAERLGCVAYLRKPCEAETILGLLHAISARHRPST